MERFVAKDLFSKLDERFTPGARSQFSPIL